MDIQWIAAPPRPMQIVFALPASRLPGALAPAPDQRTRLIRLAGARARAGFPSPADDYIERTLDLHDYLVRHEAATFFWPVRGHSMRGAGILDDVLVVDRALAPASGDIVLVTIEGAAIVKYPMRRGDLVWLEEAAPERARLVLHNGQEAVVWGVVGVVRRVR